MMNPVENWYFMGPIWNPILFSVLYGVGIYLQTKFNRQPNRNLGQFGSDFMQIFCIVGAVAHFGLLGGFSYLAYQLNYNVFCERSPNFDEKASSDSAEEEDLSSKTKKYISSWFESAEARDEKQRRSELEIQAAMLLWIYMFTKLLEFSDQIVLILTNRLTHTLDIVHHIVMACITWLGLKYFPGGSTIIMVMCSCTFLTFAYGVQAVKRTSRRLLTDENWDRLKEIVLIAKNIHFCLVGVHCLTILGSALTMSCDYSKLSASTVLLFVIVLLVFSLRGHPPGGGTIVTENAERPADQPANQSGSPQGNDGDSAKEKTEAQEPQTNIKTDSKNEQPPTPGQPGASGGGDAPQAEQKDMKDI